MRRWIAALCLAAPAATSAQPPEIQRALIERDQQSAEFAARLRGQDIRPLESLHARQLSEALQPASPEPGIARALEPIQRQQMAIDRSQLQLRFESPIFEPAHDPAGGKALPLPGRPQAGVDTVGPDRVGR